MRGIRISITALAFLPLLALAEPERHIPKGEEYPAYIEKLYSSPVGEVQFTEVGKGHSGFLRNSKGNLMSLQDVRGSSDCDDWFASTKWTPLPVGCEFVFYDEYDGRYQAVRSEEMEEATIFQTTHGKMRGWRTSASGASGGPHVSL
ncbi:MAG TPA: hypothetical protein VIH99_13365 [Bdellovibrionota bacterium]|jgi:hypothetical protein